MKAIFKLIPQNSFFALSAGVDSVACSHFLASKGRLAGIVHANNRLTADDDKMEQAAYNLAKYLKLPFNFERNYEKYEKGSVEDWCRQKRFGFFERFSGKLPYRPTILTAHNLDDCVESYLINCLRGHSDFKPMPITSEFINFSLARPFLLTSKQDMVQYCRDNNLMQFVIDDPLNKDTLKMRNWLRLDLIPQINSRVNLKTVVRKKVEKNLKDNYNL